MEGHTKPKFKKAKLPQIPVYKDIEAEQKKNTPNLRLAKLDQIEKDGVEVTLKTEWDYKIQNLTFWHGVNMSLINNSTIAHSN